jgi:hypothetical protein
MMPIVSVCSCCFLLRTLVAWAALTAGLLNTAHAEKQSKEESLPRLRVSMVANNGMPKEIVKHRSLWNFGPGSLWTHHGWQYAAYWDDARQVTVARRQLPDGDWEVTSLQDYQRTSTGDRGKGGVISRGFGDGHEKVAMGISADGYIHLSFDHHLSRLRYRVTEQPVAANPAMYQWSAKLFGPVQHNLGGPVLDNVTYPSFTADGDRLVLYLRMGGGAGAANSHYFTYEDGRWTVNTERDSQFIDQHWSGNDGTVNAYLHGLAIHDGRWHITWCWRDTPDPRTSHHLCYAYSDDRGVTWRNNAGNVIGVRGQEFITADSPGVAVWNISSGRGYRNGGSMAVDSAGRVHVLAYGEPRGAIHFMRDPDSRKWSREPFAMLGKLIPLNGGGLILVNSEGVFRTEASKHGGWKPLVLGKARWFEDSSIGVDVRRVAADGWVSVIGQQGKAVRVVDYRLD